MKTKPYITEISESDFRKLNVVVHEMNPYSKEPTKAMRANEIIDREIKGIIDGGCESQLEWLTTTPITFAVAKDGEIWWDKFMNRFSPASDHYVGVGIRHLYSTRDYFVASDDSLWRIPKKTAKAVYRIHLDPKWERRFSVKRKVISQPWPYGKTSFPTTLEIHVKLVDGKWVEEYRTKHEYRKWSESITTVDENGNERERK